MDMDTDMVQFVDINVFKIEPRWKASKNGAAELLWKWTLVYNEEFRWI